MGEPAPNTAAGEGAKTPASPAGDEINDADEDPRLAFFEVQEPERDGYVPRRRKT